jgi:hypothetical protein
VRAALGFWLQRVEERIDDWPISERFDYPSTRPFGATQRFLCRLFGHDPIRDQCGIPEHDFCVFCHASTPRQAASPASLQAQIERVRELHFKSRDGDWCENCCFGWPCKTIRALDGQEGP